MNWSVPSVTALMPSFFIESPCLIQAPFNLNMDGMMDIPIYEPFVRTVRSERSVRCKSASTLKTLQALLLLSALIVLACAREAVLKPTEEPQTALEPWSIENYAAFVRQNMAYLNEAYTTDYVASEFIVDTDSGAVPIQELIDVELAAGLLKEIDRNAPRAADKIQNYFNYARSRFDYRADPEHWSPVQDILKIGHGDCKGLSLLLVSLLTAAGVESYAAVSNGHMWVSAFDGNRWLVLETDADEERTKIYSLPGFYENPLYKIYPHITFKRKAREDRLDVR
jgi:hypothetical protein